MLFRSILVINQYPDYEADKLCNKRNWVVRLGKTKALKVYVVLFVLSYLSIIVLLVWTRNPFWLLSFTSMPFVVHAVRVASSSYNDIPNFIPANVNTLITYQLNGAAMVFSAVLRRFI